MEGQRSNGHTVSRLTVHIVWSTKYRYSVLEGDIKVRCRTLLIQICEAEDVIILKGVVSADHVHLHINYRPSHSVSDLVKKLKGEEFKKTPTRIPGLKEEVLGTTFLGNRIWLLEYRKHNR